MSNHEEQISSLMDGELSASEICRALDGLSANLEARRKWTRYHLARHLLREEHFPAAFDASLAERISRTVDAEPHWLVPGAKRPFRETPAVRWAVAASLVAFVILASQELWVRGGAPSSAPPVMASVADKGSEAQLLAEAEAEERLRNYLIMHNESIRVAGDDETLASARKVSYSP